MIHGQKNIKLWLFLPHMLCNVEWGGQVVRVEARRRGALQSTVLAFTWDYYG